MTEPHTDRAACGVCGRDAARRKLTAAATIRPGVAARLDVRAPDWRASGRGCAANLMAARRADLKASLADERGEIAALDTAVIDALARHETTTRDPEAHFDADASPGDRLADRVAAFGGSWAFIGAFLGMIAVWIAANLTALAGPEPFDPWPFILLNLVLSCVAAIQAPFIMMSQRRVETKDRLRARNDYLVNLKAELEIRQLHEKIDHLMASHWERLAELQQTQIEIIEQIARGRA